MKLPPVSILIPNHQMSHHLPSLIRNIEQQLQAEDEVIIFFDGTPLTEELLRFIRQRTYISFKQTREQVGASEARNRLLGLAKNELVRFQDADNTFAPHALYVARRYAKALQDQSWHVLLGGQLVYKDGLLDQIDLGEFQKRINNLDISNSIELNMCFFNKQSVQSIGGFDQQLKQLAHWDLWLRLQALHSENTFQITSQLFGVKNIYTQEQANKKRQSDVNGIPVEDYIAGKKNG